MGGTSENLCPLINSIFLISPAIDVNVLESSSLLCSKYFTPSSSGLGISTRRGQAVLWTLLDNTTKVTAVLWEENELS